MGMMTNWIFNGQPFLEIPEKKICFVYLITNNLSGKQYFGKKKFYFSKTKQIKGKRKKYKAESDWREYWGSNEELKNDVILHGPENFKREIIRLCDMQGESSYFEAKFQFENDVLLKPDLYYNSWISIKITKAHLKKQIISS